MVFPQNMVQMRFEFQYANLGENQTCGMWGVVSNEGVEIPFPDWQPTIDAIAKQSRDAWVSEMDKALFSQGVIAQRVVAYHYSQDHKTVLHRGEAAFDGASAWTGTGGGGMPPQNAVVLSTYAYDPAGYAQQRARKRGRMYLPTLGSGTTVTDGRLSAAAIENFLASSTDMFNAISDVLDIEGQGVGGETHFRPSISSSAAGDAFRITHLRVGNIVDTHRSRRGQLGEAYQSRPLNP